MKKQLVNGILAAIVACAFGLSGCNYEVPGDDGHGFGTGGGGSSAADVNGRLPGKFSVSKDKKVSFSKGNLQYRASSNTWRFAENQYNFVGGTSEKGDYELGNVYYSGVKCSNNLISSTYDGWIDLFGWGTSGWASGYPSCMPFNTSTKKEDYIHGVDLTGDFIHADWGIHNAIANGGKKPGLWRLLTFDEWDYIRNKRPNASKLIGMGGVYDTQCTILLPDNFNLDGITDFQGLVDAHYITFSSYEDYDKWRADYGKEYDKLEAAGVVFLPKAYYRRGNTVLFGTPYIEYWKSTHYAYNEGDMGALSMLCHTDYPGVGFLTFVNEGLAVRLVQDIK